MDSWKNFSNFIKHLSINDENIINAGMAWCQFTQFYCHLIFLQRQNAQKRDMDFYDMESGENEETIGGKNSDTADILELQTDISCCMRRKIRIVGK